MQTQLQDFDRLTEELTKEFTFKALRFSLNKTEWNSINQIVSIQCFISTLQISEPLKLNILKVALETRDSLTLLKFQDSELYKKYSK